MNDLRPLDLPSRATRRRHSAALVAMLIGVIAGLSAMLGLGASAQAAIERKCTCNTQAQTTASQAREADVIFAGVIRSVQRDPVENKPDVSNDTYVAAVESVYKGKLSTAEATFRTDRVFGQCLGVFAEGDDVMVFALNNEPLEVRSCDGTSEASEALVSEVESIFGAGKSPLPPEPVEVSFDAPADQPGEPDSALRSAAPGIAVILVATACLIVVRLLDDR